MRKCFCSGLWDWLRFSFFLCIADPGSGPKGHAMTALIRVYVVSVILTVNFTLQYSLPFSFIAAICGYGILFPVPPILQIIAAVKLIQATKE